MKADKDTVTAKLQASNTVLLGLARTLGLYGSTEAEHELVKIHFREEPVYQLIPESDDFHDYEIFGGFRLHFMDAEFDPFTCGFDGEESVEIQTDPHTYVMLDIRLMTFLDTAMRCVQAITEEIFEDLGDDIAAELDELCGELSLIHI